MNAKIAQTARALLDASYMLPYEYRLARYPIFSIAAQIRLGFAEVAFRTACRKFGYGHCFGAFTAFWLDKQLKAVADGHSLIHFADSWSLDAAIMSAVHAQQE